MENTYCGRKEHGKKQEQRDNNTRYEQKLVRSKGTESVIIIETLILFFIGFIIHSLS